MVQTRFLPFGIGDAAARAAAPAQSLAERLPALAADGRRVAAALSHGIHGKRRAGAGENFWQFRPFTAGEPASRIDWRRSARDGKLHVREREWEAARNIWFWTDFSASMFYVSDLATASKIDRALVLAFAGAELLSTAGERVGLMGLTPPLASRRITERLVGALSEMPNPDPALPQLPLAPRDEIVLISDFLMPLDTLATAISGLAARGARGHLVTIIDPVEESFPFDGQALLHDDDSNLALRIGDAATWRTEYIERLAAFRAAISDLVAAKGWTLTLHRTDRPASEAALKLATLLGAARIS